MSVSRRNFVSAALGGSLAGGVGLAVTSNTEAHEDAAPASDSLVTPGATILFQGDSITDAKRDRGDAAPNSRPALGKGYAFMAAAELMVRRPDDGLTIYNRGISGNKVYQLADRWQTDCLDLKPDIVSILIGVNDIWHQLRGKYDGTIETYRRDYRELAERTRQALPKAKLVVCEPFVLKTGAVGDNWFPLFDEFRAAAKAVADDFADAWVPFQSVFDRAEAFAPADVWAGDGVHPSSHGAALMANAWVAAVGG